MANAIVTVIRPQLTEEEREKRIDEIKKRMIDFWIAKEAKERESRE